MLFRVQFDFIKAAFVYLFFSLMHRKPIFFKDRDILTQYQYKDLLMRHRFRERLRKKILSKLSKEAKFYVDLFCGLQLVY